MKNIGLVLGSGGARGWAHIGVVDALREAGVRIGCVAGTSMGSLVGAAFAVNRTDALKNVALELDWKKVLYYFLEVTFPRSGLIDGTKIAEFVRRHITDVRIESLRVPFSAVATDVMTGREMVIRSGSLIDSVRASISVPGIFTPVLREKTVLVDGGLVNPVPVSVARAMGAEFVIAVDINHGSLSERAPRAPRKPAAPPKRSRAEELKHLLLQKLNQRIDTFDLSMLTSARRWFVKDGLPNVFDVLGNSIRIMEAQITETRLKMESPDLLIRPSLQHISFMDFHRADEAIRAGYSAAKAQLGLLPAGVRESLRG